MTKSGNIEGWPEGWFDAAWDEVTAIQGHLSVVVEFDVGVMESPDAFRYLTEIFGYSSMGVIGG
ncbi:MAG: hypothetical protein R3F60_11085 [bacterium]